MDGGARAIASLKEAAALTALTLNLWCHQIGPAGAKALAALKDAPTLTFLSLDLGYNHLVDRGA